MESLKILVVDDEARMRKLVKDFLTIKGFTVIEAEDGEQAVDIFFKQKDISLIILDVMMPKMDGWEVLKTVRQYSQIPVIMLTARGEERDELQGFKLGVDEYISKPFSPKILVARVEAILRRSNVAVSETTEVGDDVMIYQGVTLGGTGKDLGKRHPTIENGVMIGSGAKVLGPITIGRNAKVAAGAVVVKDVEPNCTVVGVPGEVVRIDGERVDDLDQINLPDPVMNAIQQNEAKINALQAEIEKIKEQLK